MRGLVGLLLLSLGACMGCGSPPIRDGDPAQRARHRCAALLSPGERKLYDLLEADAERDRFLREVGATAELRLREALARGMSSTDVAQRFGQPEDRESVVNGAATYVYWTYREPVSELVLVKAELQFRDDRLVGWEVFRDGGE